MKNSVIYIIATLALFFIGGCHNKHESSTEKLLRSYIGHKLYLPPESQCNLLDRSFGVESLDADYLIVSYVNSDGCTPCHLKLPYWKAIAERLDTISDAFATVLLIIKPDTLDKVTEFMREAYYDYPVIIDTAGVWSSLNHLPSASILHTVLIDQDSRIVAMGNPVLNEEVEQLYYDIITGSGDVQASESPLTMHNNKKDFGVISPSSVNRLDFIINNHSSDTASLVSVTTPCPCVKVNTTDIIRPHGNSTVSISFDASKSRGAFHHPVVLRYSNSERPLIIHLYGYVE